MASEERDQNTAGPAQSAESGPQTPRAPGRRALIRSRQESSQRSRPFIVAGLVIILGLLAIPIYGYVQRFVVPPRQLAVRVQDAEYTRGDVVNFIRFNQRLSEDLGVQFQIGNSLFDALQIIQDNELSFQAAPTLGVAVSPEEVEGRIENLLGFQGLTAEERANLRTRQSLEEAKRQFLNKVALSEEVYRDIIRKSLFKEKVRENLGQGVPRIQPQVHLYEIVLTDQNAQTLQRIERALAGGDRPADVALQFSQDPNVKRTNGDAGWFPRRVLPEIEGLLWGTKADGSRVLPIGVPSDPQYNAEAKTYNIYVVTEFSEAREIDERAQRKLAEDALQTYLGERRRVLSETGGIWMALDDKIYAWVNKQVRLASLLPTPMPQSGLSQFGLQGAP
jgi:hypothetical protein